MRARLDAVTLDSLIRYLDSEICSMCKCSGGRHTCWGTIRVYNKCDGECCCAGHWFQRDGIGCIDEFDMSAVEDIIHRVRRGTI